MRVDRVRDLAAAMRVTVRLDELDTVFAVDAHDPGEPRLGSDPVDRILQATHARSVSEGAGILAEVIAALRSRDHADVDQSEVGERSPEVVGPAAPPGPEMVRVRSRR